MTAQNAYIYLPQTDGRLQLIHALDDFAQGNYAGDVPKYAFWNVKKMKNVPSAKLTLLLCLVHAATACALSAIPGAAGYGIHSAGGRGGTIYKVTSLGDEDVPGTLRYGLTHDWQGPVIIVFEVSGTILVNGYLKVIHPYTTIAGQTAPSPGIFLRGCSLGIVTHDVVIQHIRIGAGDDPYPNVNRVPTTGRDCLFIDCLDGHRPYNIVVDHCTLTWSVDELFNCWNDTATVTIRHCILSEPLHESIHLDEDIHGVDSHGMGPLFGNFEHSKVTMVGNLISHCYSRMPMSEAAEFVMVNNLVYDHVELATAFRNNHRVPTRNTVVGNVFMQGPSTVNKSVVPIVIRRPFMETSRLYVHDNDAPDFPVNEPWDLVRTASYSDRTRREIEATSAPVWHPGLEPIPSRQLADWLLPRVGARPLDRLPYETRIVNNVRQKTGAIMDSIAEAGGWPEVARNCKSLVVPSNPHRDDDGDGYTNAEEWLDSYAAALEGR